MDAYEANNLDRARSPYLRQHQDNPVHWQQWSRELLEHAQAEERPLFVSVGYSTCHWCHVMAREAFSDPEIAAYLNANFVPIKVDREERPDIDQYLMDFLVATTGSGGWPLNAFLSPEGAPFFAMTYAPVEPRFNMPGFLEILKRVKSFYDEKKGELRPYQPESYQSGRDKSLRSGSYDERIEGNRSDLFRRYDGEWAGFGNSQKFPPHSQLLYLLYDGVISEEPESLRLAEQTLDTIYLRGLHDHLQGGFFRYCVDREWTIPHFEKMLYDQAMLLWSFSWGYRALGKGIYLTAIEGIYHALESTLALDGLYAAGLDADTDHEEGATYLWEPSEVRKFLGEEDFDRFSRYFESVQSGNFEGKLHLVAIDDPRRERQLSRALERLLERRNRRRQPARDDKIITEWNALAGVGLIEAGRATGREEYSRRAGELYRRLREVNEESGNLAHSSLPGMGRQDQEFLDDRAALLLFESYLFEEDRLEETTLHRSAEALLSFREGNEWHRSKSNDFFTMPADIFDSPIPSAASLAEMALLRYRLLTDGEYDELPQARATLADFYNLAARWSAGEIYLIKAPTPLSWRELPFPAVQGRAERENYCFRGVCYFGLPVETGRS